MGISEICIRRPVFTWVLVASPVVLGLMSYLRLGVDLFPDVDFPVCTVTTTLPGASAEEMETSVTKPIEDVINTVSGVDAIQSTSSEGVSMVIVRFLLSKNGDVGAQEVRDKVGAILTQLPSGTEQPIVDRFETDSQPVMTIAVSGRRDLREVTEIARKQIKEQLETVSGVGAATIIGGRTRAMNVTVDPDKLTAYRLSIDDVRMALERQNMEVPGGHIDQGPRELMLRTLGRLHSAYEFNNAIVSNRGGYPIRIKDVGEAVDSVEEPRSLARLDGQPAVSVTVQKQSGTNVVKVTDAVKAKLRRITKGLPDDVKIELIRDQSRFVKKSIEEVKFHLLLAAALVSATILLFIRDWRTTVIATLAIPTSIIPTFAFMYYMGFTLNNITMLGLILAIGIVIDDAVVVHENIFRHMEEHGLGGMEAARIGTREIILPVMATSLSLVVIFLPLAFMGGIVGRFFSSYGLTVAFAIMMSLFVSFTLTPMLCSRFLKLEPSEEGSAKSKSGFIWRAIDGFYGAVLRLSLRAKWAVVAISVIVILSTVPIGRMVGFALIPRDDQSEYEVHFYTPEGYSLDRTDRVLKEIEDRLWKLPGTVHVFSEVGSSVRAAKGQGAVTEAKIYVRIEELGERKVVPEFGDRPYTQDDVQMAARKILSDYPDLRGSVNDVSPFQGGGRAQIFQVELHGPELGKLEELANAVASRLKRAGGVTDVDTTLALRKPELQVVIDREASSDLGISVGTIADTLRILVGGLAVSTFRDAGEQYDVWLRAHPDDRTSAKDLYGMSITSPRLGPVLLSSLAHLEEERGPSQIERKDRQRMVTVLANPAPGVALSDVQKNAEAILNDLDMPPAYNHSLGGQAETLAETGYFLVMAFVLSIAFMYLILAAQFESWSQPIAILMALPVTIPFGLLSLYLAGTPMDIYAMFGLFMLVGIVKKNGILQIDATNQLRATGMPREQAVLEANHTRLRPILMTTVMLVAAMVPIALGKGPGSGARASMAKVIIGGQSLSLLLALIVTPVFYMLLDSFGSFLHRIGVRFSVEQSPAEKAAPPALASAEPEVEAVGAAAER